MSFRGYFGHCGNVASHIPAKFGRILKTALFLFLKWLLWLYPICDDGYSGDGLSFNVNEVSEDDDEDAVHKRTTIHKLNEND